MPKKRKEEGGDEGEKFLEASETVPEPKDPETESETTAITFADDDGISLASPGNGAGSAFDQEDLVIPRLQLAHNVGTLGQDFGAGSFVLDGSVAMSDGEAPLSVTVVGLTKCFMENVDFNDDKIPNVVQSKSEVHALGHTTVWSEVDGERQPPGYLPTVNALLLVRRPKVLDEEGAECACWLEAPDGQEYTLAQMRFKGTGYSNAARSIISAIKFERWANPSEAEFALSAPQRTYGKNRVHVPIAKRGPKHKSDFVEWANDIATELIT